MADFKADFKAAHLELDPNGHFQINLKQSLLTLKGCEAKCVCDDGLYRSRETGHCVPIEEACERQCRTGTS